MSDKHLAAQKEILEVFRDNDKLNYDRYQLLRMLRWNAAHAILEAALARELDIAAHLRTDGDPDEAREAAINVYTTIYLFAGLSQEDARKKAEELEEEGEEGGLGGLRMLF